MIFWSWLLPIMIVVAVVLAVLGLVVVGGTMGALMAFIDGMCAVALALLWRASRIIRRTP